MLDITRRREIRQEYEWFKSNGPGLSGDGGVRYFLLRARNSSIALRINLLSGVSRSCARARRRSNCARSRYSAVLIRRNTDTAYHVYLKVFVLHDSF